MCPLARFRGQLFAKLRHMFFQAICFVFSLSGRKKVPRCIAVDVAVTMFNKPDMSKKNVKQKKLLQVLQTLQVKSQNCCVIDFPYYQSIVSKAVFVCCILGQCFIGPEPSRFAHVCIARLTTNSLQQTLNIHQRLLAHTSPLWMHFEPPNFPLNNVDVEES